MTSASTDTQAALNALHALRNDLARLRQGAVSVQVFSDEARAGSAAVLAALPARYGDVLLGLLDRLESAALFSEESCSFSQKDLLDSLQMWVDKAGAALGAAD